MRELHLFAGAGGGILAGMLLGHKPVCAVEIEPYCQDVLRARQRDGILPEFPIFGDIREFDGKPWKGKVDIVAGGFPCTDIASCGKRHGIQGEQSSLWSEMFRIVCEVRPRIVFVENSPDIIFRGLDTVLGDLASVGYDAKWMRLSASDVGANHVRKRFWAIAYPKSKRPFVNEDNQRKKRYDREDLQQKNVWGCSPESRLESIGYQGPGIPENLRMDDGFSGELDGRIKALGNGQVPAVAATAFRILSQGLI